MKFECGEDRIKLKYNTEFILYGLFVFATGIFLFSTVAGFFFGEDVLVIDLVLTGMMSLIPLFLGRHCFINGFKKLEITESGVCSGMRFYEWAKIKDWGVSYYATARGGDSSYCLYFSENKLHEKLKGKMIKFIVSEKNLPKIINNVVPFCKEKTEVSPIIFRQFEV